MDDNNNNSTNNSNKREIPPLNVEQRLWIARDITRGLSYLHSMHNIIHRDIKSHNILVRN